MSILVPSWGRSSPGARPAFLAAYWEIVLEVLLIALAIVFTLGSVVRGEEPLILKGGLIGPQVAFIVLMAGIVLLQLAIAAALRHSLPWVRWAGIVVAGIVALFGLLTVALLVVGIVQAAMEGFARYSSEGADAVGMAIFIPIIGVLAWLNGRAALRTRAEMRSR